MPTRIVEGRKAPVYFYPKDDTPGCTKEACGFRDDGNVRKHWARVADAAKHPAQVLEQIRGEDPGGK